MRLQPLKPSLIQHNGMYNHTGQAGVRLLDPLDAEQVLSDSDAGKWPLLFVSSLS